MRDWFAPLRARIETEHAKRYCVDKLSATLPMFTLQVLERRPAGDRPVFDLAVEDARAFVAGTIAVHNCIGNSGPLPEEVAEAVREHDLVVAAVLSGNRNFEGRIHPLVRASYLASPPLVVAYALAGTVDIDLTTQPLGTDRDGKPVFLRDLWPTSEEVRAVLASALKPELFAQSYGTVFEGDERWRALPVPEGGQYAWDAIVDLHPGAAVLRRPDARAGAAPRHPRRAGAGDARRLGHHRPHLAGRLDPEGQPRGPLPRSTTASSRRTSTATARGAEITRS